MIAMLEILPDERRSFIKKFDYFYPRKISAQLIFIGEIPMVSVRHREHARGINWKGLESITEAAHWLLPKGTRSPQNSRIINFIPRLLPPMLMDNIAVSVLENAQIKPSALSVGIYPEKHTDIIEPLIERAKEVRILCDNENEEFCQEIMDKYGAAIICSDRTDIFDRCQMIVASRDKKGRAKATKNALLFSPAENQPSALHVRSTLPQTPEIYSYPSRLFGTLRALSAFYELENRHELGLITPSLARLENGIIDTSELSRYLRNLA